MNNRVFGAILMLGMLSILLTGCCDKMGRYDIVIEADEGLKTATTVDVIGVSPSLQPRYHNQNVTEYFNPQNPAAGLRAGANNQHMIYQVTGKDGKLTPLQFTVSGARSITIGKDDPIWEKWAQGGPDTQLYIIANLEVANPAESPPGIGDVRRAILPLNACAWPDWLNTPGAIHILISRSGVESKSIPKSQYQIR